MQEKILGKVTVSFEKNVTNFRKFEYFVIRCNKLVIAGNLKIRFTSTLELSLI